MDVIKMEVEVDPLTVHTIDNGHVEEKKPLREEGNFFDFHMADIKMECEDHGCDLTSEIKVEETTETAVPTNFVTLKCEAEQERGKMRSNDGNTSSTESEYEHALGRKRKIQKENWKKEVAKKKRNAGEDYVSTKTGKKVSAKKFKVSERCCPKKCFLRIEANNQEIIHNSFWATGDKNIQDTLMLSLIDRKNLSRISNEPKSGRNRSCSYIYHLKIKEEKVVVCKSLFQNVLNVTEGRIKTVLQALKSGAITVEDKRGKHSNRLHKITMEIWEMVQSHWDLFPSHYCQGRSHRKYFDNPDLNVAKLFKSFQTYFLTERNQVLQMKYKTYHKYFRENSSYSFRKPTSDACDLCRKSGVILSVNANDPCKNSTENLCNTMD
ncbi:uncharacterized protein [Periplaneta americana]